MLAKFRVDTDQSSQAAALIYAYVEGDVIFEFWVSKEQFMQIVRTGTEHFSTALEKNVQEAISNLEDCL